MQWYCFFPGISKLTIWNVALALQSHYVCQFQQHRDCGCNFSCWNICVMYFHFVTEHTGKRWKYVKSVALLLQLPQKNAMLLLQLPGILANFRLQSGAVHLVKIHTSSNTLSCLLHLFASAISCDPSFSLSFFYYLCHFAVVNQRSHTDLKGTIDPT